MLREQFLKLRDGMFHLQAVFVIDDDGEGKLTEVLALHTERGEGSAQLGDRGFLGVIDQLVFRIGVLLVLKVRDKAGLRVVVMATAGGNLFAGFRVVHRMPFGHDMEIGRDVEQPLQQQGRVSLGISFSVRTRTKLSSTRRNPRCASNSESQTCQSRWREPRSGASSILEGRKFTRRRMNRKVFSAPDSSIFVRSLSCPLKL